MVSTIDYYLSLASPWSYLGHQRLMNIADKYDCQINVHAVDLSIILPATGGIALPKRSQQRKDYRMQELKRWRDYLSLPLNCEPKHFPVIDEVAAAMLLAIREEDQMASLKFASSCLSAVWVDEKDISDLPTLLDLASGHGIDGEALLAKKESMLSIRRVESERAISKGVYGVPSYVVDGEVFWGQDRLDFLERLVAK